jgi:hypothetical protein
VSGGTRQAGFDVFANASAEDNATRVLPQTQRLVTMDYAVMFLLWTLGFQDFDRSSFFMGNG